MEIANALDALMTAENLRPENVASTIGCSAQAVRNWRAGASVPKAGLYIALRRHYPAFAAKMDAAAA